MVVGEIIAGGFAGLGSFTLGAFGMWVFLAFSMTSRQCTRNKKHSLGGDGPINYCAECGARAIATPWAKKVLKYFKAEPVYNVSEKKKKK